jgi:transcription elongation factor GreA
VTTTGSQSAEPAKLTRETYDRLQDELLDLTTRGRVEIAEIIEAARALGDLKENGDYHAAKDSQGKMEARIRQLQALLKEATVVDADDEGDGTVVTGTVVTLRYEGDDDDDTQDFFVGSIEERPSGLSVVSPSAPLGQALIGHQAGETVEYQAPGGSLRVEIVKVTH